MPASTASPTKTGQGGASACPAAVNAVAATEPATTPPMPKAAMSRAAVSPARM